MQQQRRSGLIIGLVALGLLAGVALTAGPAQAVDAVGPYYALPSWDRKVGVVNRFVVLMDWSSQAVLDKETGLVWERTPSLAVVTWIDARHHCTNDTTTGDQKGWRLPALHELVSLIDRSVPSPGPALPPGHPFTTGATGVQSADYWSATTNAANLPHAWFVGFGNGVVNEGDNTSRGYVWCVRGGMNADTY